MVQILKESVRDQITEAALTRFAKDGFTEATMAAISSEAGVATGTIYKYFDNKNSLFEHVIPDAFVEEYGRLTRDRIASFEQHGESSPGLPGPDGEPGELLRFIVRNRLQVIILLSRAAGTRHASFARDYVATMESQALSQARRQFPGLRETETFLFMARRIFENSVRDTVSILEHFRTEKEIARALSAMSACQVAGLLALADWTRQEGER